MSSVAKRFLSRHVNGFQRRRAVAGAMGGLTSTVIGIVIALIAVAILFPIAGKLIFNANMTGWDSTSKSTFPLIFLVAVAAVIIGLVVRAFVHR